MTGFLRGFFPLTTLISRSTTKVISTAGRKAIKLAIVGQINKALAIFTVLAQHYCLENAEEYNNRLFNQMILRVTLFLYKDVETLPPEVGEVNKLHGEDEQQHLEDQFLRGIRSSLGPEEAIDITRNVTEADFENLNSLVKKTLEFADPHLNAMTGASPALPIASMQMGKPETCPVSGLHGRHISRLAGYAINLIYRTFILTVTKKRLEGELVMHGDEYKDKSFQEMLDELDWNTLRFPEMWEDYSDGDESTLPRTILRAPARADEIARVESKLGCTLPNDLKKFYTLTNGTQPVISGPHFYRLNNPILSVLELHWENFSWMGGYELDLFPETSLPVHIVLLTIEGGGGRDVRA